MMPLRQDDKIAVVKTTGGDRPEYYTIQEVLEATAVELDIGGINSEIGDINSEIGDINSEIGDINTTLSEPSISRKLDAFKTGIDTEWEVLENKIIREPIINQDEVERASVAILTDFIGDVITLYSRIYGDAGNAYTIEVIASGANTELSIACSEAGAIVINLATNADEEPITARDSLFEMLYNNANINNLFIVEETKVESDAIIQPMEETNFTGGANGTLLTVNGAQINDAVASVADLNSVVQEEGTPVAPVVAQAITGEGQGYEITWTAATAGRIGNDIEIKLVEQAAEAPLALLSVVGKVITIGLEMGEGAEPVPVGTATALATFVNENDQLQPLVSAELTGGGGAPTAETAETEGGVDGTVAEQGKILYDETGIYISVGESTTAVSNWKKISFDAE
jgi:hypothetical protein